MAWLTPTLRAMRWSPMLVAVALAPATVTLVRVADRPLLPGLAIALLSMLVVSGLSGLHDPGRSLVQALPVSAARRLLHRLVVIVPVVAVGLLGLRALISELYVEPTQTPGWGALAALGTVGVAVCAGVTRRLGARAADVALSVMLVWIVTGVTLVEADAPLWGAMPWWRWPAFVGVSAAVVTFVATTSGPRA